VLTEIRGLGNLLYVAAHAQSAAHRKPVRVPGSQAARKTAHRNGAIAAGSRRHSGKKWQAGAPKRSLCVSMKCVHGQRGWHGPTIEPYRKTFNRARTDRSCRRYPSRARAPGSGRGSGGRLDRDSSHRNAGRYAPLLIKSGASPPPIRAGPRSGPRPDRSRRWRPNPRQGLEWPRFQEHRSSSRQIEASYAPTPIRSGPEQQAGPDPVEAAERET
jgi:hypothetical protein